MPEQNNPPRSDIQMQLSENKATIEQVMGNSIDFQKRTFTICNAFWNVSGICYFLDGMAEYKQIQDILETMTSLNDGITGIQFGPGQTLLTLVEQAMVNEGVKTVRDLNTGLDAMLNGDTLVLFDGYTEALIVSSKGWKQRSVDEPSSETVVRGPRDGFTENIRTNTTLLRRRIKDPGLRIGSMQVGTKTKTEVEVAYIEGIAKPGLVDEVNKRMKDIKIDGVLESGYIEELINDAPWSPFYTIQATERPDKVAAALLEGRVAIFVDNTPFVLLAPTYFWQFIQASDDYYSRFWVGTFYRMIRYVALIISLTLPSIYVMLVTFHQEMIPTQLVLTIASGLEVVPFPVLLEALLMETAFELMREAGLRMPRTIGQAVSIVGSLIIGQAAVQAGLVSPFMVIVVAVTGICSFVIPNYGISFSIRILRFPLLIASGSLGLLGFAAVMFVIIIHAISIRSFGEPYFAPATPFRASDQKDIFFRLPWWKMRNRPQLAQDSERLGSDPKPKPAPPKKPGDQGKGGSGNP